MVLHVIKELKINQEKFMSKSIHPFPSDAANKRFIALRYWLLGQKYHHALRSLDFNSRLFTGMRKDGVTPEFDHHVCQAQYLRTLLPYLIYPEETICTTLFHDTIEDKSVSALDVQMFFPEASIGIRVSQATTRMSKVRGIEKISPDVLFPEMSKCPIASICKGVDRFHNLQSMLEVFTLKKQKEYVQETIDWILPMLKDAENRFPSQEPAYKNIRTMLKSQITIINLMHEHIDRLSPPVK